MFQVIDGTICDLRDGIMRICVEGKCRQVSFYYLLLGMVRLPLFKSVLLFYSIACFGA